MSKVLENYYGIDDIYDEVYSKHFRTHYAGKPTKKYLRLMKKIGEYENAKTRSVIK